MGEQTVLTYLDGMTGFAHAAFLQEAAPSAAAIAVATFTHFFVPFGMPRLVVVDAGGEFAGIFREMCRTLLIPIDTAAPENHKAVRNERFHRYLNKVQRINTANKDSMHQWKQGTLFALYAWNAAPIDGTDIPRSYVALGRAFPFPIDLATDTRPRRIPDEGQDALDHADASFPLLRRQQELLAICNQERRRRHRELRNDTATPRTFQPGDLVVIRKQVHSKTADGISAKLMFRAKGPYRVVDQTPTGTYRLIKLPFLEGLGRPGRLIKEAAFRLEKLPSTLVIHRCADGTDTRFASLRGPFAPSPLEKWLGALNPGAYRQAAPEQNHAFEPLANMWSDDVDPPDDDVAPNDDDDNEPPRDAPPEAPHDSSDSEDDDDTDSDDDDTDNPAGTPPAPAPRPAAPTSCQPRDLLPADPPHAPAPVARGTTTPGDTSDQPTTDPNRQTRAQRRAQGRADRKTLHNLYTTISNSRDRLFFIRHRPTTTSTAQWQLVEIDLDETDPRLAKTMGTYTARWYRPHHTGVLNKPLLQCRFWPDIHERHHATKNTTSTPLHISPAKIDRLATTRPRAYWTTTIADLTTDALVGPFNFRHTVPPTRIKSSKFTHYIDLDDWDSLKTIGPTRGIDTSNIDVHPRHQPATES
jgi:hypothetical protein